MVIGRFLYRRGFLICRGGFDCRDGFICWDRTQGNIVVSCLYVGCIEGWNVDGLLLLSRALIGRSWVDKGLLFDGALLVRVLIDRSLDGRVLVGRALDGRVLVGRALVGRALVDDSKVCINVWTMRSNDEGEDEEDWDPLALDNAIPPPLPLPPLLLLLLVMEIGGVPAVGTASFDRSASLLM